MSPESKVRGMKIRITIGDNWSSLNHSGLYFNRLDNRYVGDSMVSCKSSIDKRRVEEILRISLSLTFVNTVNMSVAVSRESMSVSKTIGIWVSIISIRISIISRFSISLS